MDRFIDCLVDNALETLIITGTATPEELSTHWNKIYVEYCNLSQDKSYNEILEIYKSINDLKAKLHLVNGIISHLRLKYDRELVRILEELVLRPGIKSTTRDPELEEKLMKVEGRCKKWSLQLKEREAELEKIKSKQTTEVDRNYFYDQFQNISEHDGFKVKPSEIVVAEYCRSVVKIREEYIRSQMKKVANGN